MICCNLDSNAAAAGTKTIDLGLVALWLSHFGAKRNLKQISPSWGLWIASRDKGVVGPEAKAVTKGLSVPATTTNDRSIERTSQAFSGSHCFSTFNKRELRTTSEDREGSQPRSATAAAATKKKKKNSVSCGGRRQPQTFSGESFLSAAFAERAKEKVDLLSSGSQDHFISESFIAGLTSQLLSCRDAAALSDS